MMTFCKGLRFLPFLITPVLFIAIVFNFVYGQASSTDSVSATIKISVCGNSVVEGGEDCEGGDLNGQTCVGLGYAIGTLTCDIACSFDTTACTAVTPTPTPTVTPTPTPTNTPIPTLTPTATPTSVLVATNTPAPGPTATLAPQATNTPAPVPTPVPVIPAVVAVFDLDHSGKIEAAEVFSAVKLWVDEWSEAVKEKVTARKCDVNRDGRCDLFDLSILLYYIGK